MKKHLNQKGDKYYYHLDNGRSAGQRKSTGIFTYVQPIFPEQIEHNKQAVKQLKQFTAKQPTTDFLAYYRDYIQLNRRANNRHLEGCYNQLELFCNYMKLPFSLVTQNFCKRFRRFLLDKYTGETPGNYYTRFKTVISAAVNDNLFLKNPTEHVKSKRNPSKTTKKHLEADEYKKLLNTSFTEAPHIRNAFLFSCYTGLRWVDIKRLSWQQYDYKKQIITIIQAKTGHPVIIKLHPIAIDIINNLNNRNKLMFKLPSADKANILLKEYITAAGIRKHITWHCARLSFSILLQDNNVPLADVAYLMGHRSTEHVHKTYKRHRPKDQSKAIAVLPNI
jgi:integrase